MARAKRGKMAKSRKWNRESATYIYKDTGLDMLLMQQHFLFKLETHAPLNTEHFLYQCTKGGNSRQIIDT